VRRQFARVPLRQLQRHRLRRWGQAAADC
jgi:hypothetical protein